MWILTKWKKVKEALSTNILISRKFKKQNIYSGPLVLAALKGFCGDNGHKMQTSFKTLVLKNLATWSSN